MLLTEVIVLFIPFDIANTSSGGGIPTDIIWQVLYISVFVLGLGILPFGIFYYEAEDPANERNSNWKQIRSALLYEFLVLVIFTVLTVVLWATVGIAEIPVVELTGYMVDFAAAHASSGTCGVSIFLLLFFFFPSSNRKNKPNLIVLGWRFGNRLLCQRQNRQLSSHIHSLFNDNAQLFGIVFVGSFRRNWFGCDSNGFLHWIQIQSQAYFIREIQRRKKRSRRKSTTCSCESKRFTRKMEIIQWSTKRTKTKTSI